MAPSYSLRFDANSHAWRAAKIHELGTRLGGFRAVYDSAIEFLDPRFCKPDGQYLGDDDPENVEYLLAVAKAFYYLLIVPDSDFATRTWKSLVNDGVVELYLDIVQSQGFLAEDVRLVYRILYALDRIVRASRDASGVADLLLSRMQDVWKSLWDTRQILRLRSHRQRGRDEELMISMLHQETQGVLLSSLGPLKNQMTPEEPTWFFTDTKEPPAFPDVRGYWSLYNDRYKRGPPADTYIPHMGLFLWMQGNAELASTNNAFAALCALTGLGFVEPDVSSRHAGGRSFVQEAIIDEFGLEAFCLRVDSDISQQRHPEDLCTHDYLVWKILVKVMVEPQVLPYLLAHGMLGSLISLRAALASMPGRAEEAGHVLSTTYGIFRKAFHKHWRAHIERQDAVSVCHIPGKQLVDVLASSLHNAASHGCKSREELLGERLCEDLAVTTRFFHDLRKDPKRFKPEARALFEQCRSSAPTQWYAALHAVQVSGYRGVMDQDLCRVIANGWIVFGHALGLRPEKERVRLERLKRVHCAWSLCAHHCVEPDVQLKACQGCGDVRYCSRACQKSDWKEHKGRCGNRLPAGTEKGEV